MSPLPGYKVIPDGWAEHHRPTAEGTMKSTASIVRSNGPAPYPKPADWVPEAQLWSGRCRLQELKREAVSVAADQAVSIRQYMITVPHAGLPELLVGDGGDTAIIDGERYQLLQQMRGSFLWEWDLIAQHVDS